LKKLQRFCTQKYKKIQKYKKLQRFCSHFRPAFLQLVPQHLYEQFLDHVLCALEVAAHYDSNGKALMQYIILFFPPKSLRCFKAQRCYKDRVLMPTGNPKAGLPDGLFSNQKYQFG
jgi:hypothetical protein